MKFRKEYQTYLLIVIAIIIAGYFLKHFFFNKNKKVIEGQTAATTYYRVAFSSTDVLNTSATTSTDDQDLLKELILMEYDASKIITDTTDTDIKYVKPDAKYASVIELIPDTILVLNSTGDIIGFKVVSICGRLAYFKYQAAAAADTAAADTAAATAAAAAYDYARLILSNDTAYKDDVNIMALIAAANLLTIIGQPTITTYDEAVVKTAQNAAFDADDAIDDDGNAASNAATNAMVATNTALNAMVDDEFTNAEANDAADDAAKAAGYANAYANNESLNDTTVTNNDNYTKVMTKYNSTPANMKAAFITAAGLIYQSVYTVLGGP